jgi:hypothetical protein
MEDQPWTVVVDGNGNVSEHKLGGPSPNSHIAGSPLKPMVKVMSSEVVSGIRTVVVSRALKGATSDYYTFNTTATDPTIPFIAAVGTGVTLAYHKNKLPGKLTLLPATAATTATTAATATTIDTGIVDAPAPQPIPGAGDCVCPLHTLILTHTHTLSQVFACAHKRRRHSGKSPASWFTMQSRPRLWTRELVPSASKQENAPPTLPRCLTSRRTRLAMYGKSAMQCVCSVTSVSAVWRVSLLPSKFLTRFLTRSHYRGGQWSCHHKWSLLDADQEIPWTDQPLVFHHKYRFWVSPLL